MVARIPIKQLGTFPVTPSSSNILEDVACDSSVYVGAIVRLDSVTGDFVNAQADSIANSNVFGICNAKSSSTICDVLLPGGVTESIYVGLDLTKRYFLSDTIAGGMMVPPVTTTSGHIVLCVGKPYTSSRLLFYLDIPIQRA